MGFFGEGHCGSAVSSLSRARGRVLAAKRFYHILSSQGAKNFLLTVAGKGEGVERVIPLQ